MTSAEISLAAGFLFALAHVLAVGISLRLVRRISPVIVHLFCAAALGAILPLALWIFAARFQIALPFWPAASIFYGGVIATLYAFSAVYKSISLGILQVLHTAPEGGVALERIARDFALPRFAERVELLVEGGLAERTESGYRITPQGAMQVQRLQRLQRIFAVSGKGFYLTS